MSNGRLYFAASVACMTAGLFGYSVGFVGGVLVLPSFLRHFDLTHLSPSASAAAQSRIVLIWLVGAFLGVPLGIPACSRLGRRVCLNLSALLYVSGAAMQLIDGNMSPEKTLIVFEAGRFINGLGVGTGTLVSPMYISEISPANLRGLLMSGYQTVLQFAALVGFWGAFVSHEIFPETSDTQWRIPVEIQLIPGLLLFLGTFLIPEAPRFWGEKGQWQKAEESLSWLRGLPKEDEQVIEEIDVIKASIDMIARAEYMYDGGFVKQIMRKDVRKRLGVGVGIMIAQNMVGLNALNYYSPIIFQSAGFHSVSSALFLTGLFGVIKLFAAVVFMFYCINKKTNRFWLQWGTGVCAVTMLTLAFFVRSFPPLDANRSDTSLTVGGFVAVLMVYIYTIAFGISLGPISWNIASEIYPLQINATCCAITVCAQWLFQGVVAIMTPFLIAFTGWITYLIYGGFCVLTLVWIIFCVPETRGVPLGQAMDHVFGVKESDDFVDESTSLIPNERVRKASFSSLHAPVV